MIYEHAVIAEANRLLEKLDNPACVMIRKLMARIKELEDWNNSYSEKNWKLMEEIDKLKGNI